MDNQATKQTVIGLQDMYRFKCQRTSSQIWLKAIFLIAISVLWRFVWTVLTMAFRGSKFQKFLRPRPKTSYRGSWLICSPWVYSSLLWGRLAYFLCAFFWVNPQGLYIGTLKRIPFHVYLLQYVYLVFLLRILYSQSGREKNQNKLFWT